MMEANLIQFYQSEFARLNVVPKRGGCSLEHAAWMAEEIHTQLRRAYGYELFTQEDLTKANRWIGFMQGVLWKEGIYTIDDLRAHVLAAKAAPNAAI
jgi:hypothetical protein